MHHLPPGGFFGIEISKKSISSLSSEGVYDAPQIPRSAGEGGDKGIPPPQRPTLDAGFVSDLHSYRKCKHGAYVTG